MDRNALLIYLRDACDLEIAKCRLEKAHGQALDKYKQLGSTPKPEKPVDTRKGYGIAIVLICILVFLACATWYLHIVNPNSSMIRFMGAIFLLYACFAGARIYGIIQSRIEYKTNLKEYEDNVIRASIKRWKESEIKPAVENDLKEIYREEELCIATLDKHYAINVIPSQHRNLPGVCYLYDYMSTSQVSLEEALFHAHLADGIARIMDKLDYVIAQNESILYQNRLILENQKRLEEQNHEILIAARQAARSAQEAASYAAIAESNSRISSFFSCATYLESSYRNRR